MERGFRLFLRGLLVLVVGAGVALIVYAGIAEPPGNRGGPEETAAPAGGSLVSSPADTEVAHAVPEEASSQGRTPGGGAKGTPASETRPVEDTGPGRLGLDVFETTLRDRERPERKEAMIKGDAARSVARDGEELYDINLPKVTIYQDGDAIDIEVNEIRVRAEHAELNEKRGIVRLSKNVVAEGKGFRITTEAVLYEASRHVLTSDQPVRIEVNQADGSDGGKPDLIITGTGMLVDKMLENMEILSGPRVDICGMAGDFLASGAARPADGTEAGALEDIVITCDGKLVYDHLDRTVDFFENVCAVSGERKLKGEHLSIRLAGGGSDKGAQVRSLVAAGAVELTQADQVGRGDELKWDNVTQTGVLSGAPASVETKALELFGSRLTFYRINERLSSQGAGSLLWKGQPDAQAPQPEDKGVGEGWDPGPLRLSKTGPVRVTWTEKMAYQADAGRASFTGDVDARQERSSLQCRQLYLSLDPANNTIAEVRAEDAVTIHDAASDDGRDITCDALVWDAETDSVDLVAREGRRVDVVAGSSAISAEHVVLDNRQRTLRCPAPGQLTIRPAAEDAQRPGGVGQPVTVEWAESMSFHEAPTAVAVFAGNVRAQRDAQAITGQHLALEFTADMDPVRIVARDEAAIDVLQEQDTHVAEATAAAETAALIPALPSVQGDHWRLAGQELVILPPEEQVTSAEPGVLTMMQGDQTTGSVAWTRSMKLDWAANAANFEGQVLADVAESKLRSESLDLGFDDARNLRHIWAKGTVHFEQNRADSWRLDADSAQAVFAGKSELKQIIARDDVTVRDAQRTVTCDSLQLFFAEGADEKGPEMQRAIARGDVVVTYAQTPPVEAGGDSVEWDRLADIYHLLGEPDAYIKQGKMELVSDKMDIDRKSGRMTLPPGARPHRLRIPVKKM